jgi:hypothetical protein
MKSTCYPLMIIVPLFLVIIGCKEEKPKDLPTLHPTKITLLQAGKPCADAKLSIIPIGGDSRWTSGGTTNASGVLEPMTHGKYQGVPEGKYKVTVDKSVGEGEPPPPSPIDAESRKKYNEYFAAGKTYKLFQVIPDQYRLRDRTPLELDVKPGRNNIQLEIPDEVKVEVKSSGFR